MARTKRTTKYTGPKKMLAAMCCSRKVKPKKVNKYLYSMHHKLDGTAVKRRRLNPDYQEKL